MRREGREQRTGKTAGRCMVVPSAPVVKSWIARPFFNARVTAADAGNFVKSELAIPRTAYPGVHCHQPRNQLALSR